MSLAIKFGDSTNPTSLSGAIYFNAVTKYAKNHSGKVTEHPIEAGASITDHFVSNNSKYAISGVISHVDFSTIPGMLTLEGESVMNNSQNAPPVVINDTTTGLDRVLSSSTIGQFLAQIRPDVIVNSAERLNYKLSLENFFEVLMTGLFYNETRKKWENRMVTCVLYELDGLNPVKPIQDLVVTSVQISEDPDTGDALVLDVSLEKVNFVTLEKTEAPKPRKKSNTAKGTEPKQNKGTASASNTTPPNDRETVLGNARQGNESIIRATQ